MYQPTSQIVMAAVTKCSIEVLPHPPYSPDLAPSDLKTNLPGRNLRSNESLIDAVDEYLGVNEYLGDQEEGFYFEGKQHWRKCIKAKGDYIEK